MGASILPVTVYKGKIYFLFGKEREFDENPGWSDFGGGTDNNESFLETAIREGGEELTGFLGSSADIKQMLSKYGTFPIDYKATGFGIYRVHIFPMVYDEFLPHYYNNNQQFLQKRLSRKIIKDAKIFEKTEIRWICFDEIVKMKKEFRSFYQNIVELILNRRDEINAFVRKHLKSGKKTLFKRSKRSVIRGSKKTIKRR
jgi:hypothetical protein